MCIFFKTVGSSKNQEYGKMQCCKQVYPWTLTQTIKDMILVQYVYKSCTINTFRVRRVNQDKNLIMFITLYLDGKASEFIGSYWHSLLFRYSTYESWSDEDNDGGWSGSLLSLLPVRGLPLIPGDPGEPDLGDLNSCRKYKSIAFEGINRVKLTNLLQGVANWVKLVFS